jgi:hypothetical protein
MSIDGEEAWIDDESRFESGQNKRIQIYDIDVDIDGEHEHAQ